MAFPWFGTGKTKKLSPATGDNFLNSTQQSWFDSWFTPAREKIFENGFFVAEVLQVLANDGHGSVVKWGPDVRVRAKILADHTTKRQDDEGKLSMMPGLPHQHLPEPVGTEDHDVIGLYPVFEGYAKELGGTAPKVGDKIKVDFRDRSFVTKADGNGQILALHEDAKVAGSETPPETKPGADAFDKDSKLEECQKKRKKQKLKPDPGQPLRGENSNRTISKSAPRQMQSSTDDPWDFLNIDLIAAARRASKSLRQWPSHTKPPVQANAAPGKTPPLPIKPAPANNLDTKGANIDCDKIYAVKDFPAAADANSTESKNAEKNAAAKGQSRPVDAKNTDEPEKTWHAKTNKIIKHLHPDYRAVAAKFINELDRRGYKVKITETYRTVKRQNELYAFSRFAPHQDKGWRTNAPGSPRSSMHQFGLGFDLVEVSKGNGKERSAKYFNYKRSKGYRWDSGFSKSYPMERWDEIGLIGEEFGFKWGGRFTSVTRKPGRKRIITTFKNKRGQKRYLVSKYDGPHFQFVALGASRLRKRPEFTDPKLSSAYTYPTVDRYEGMAKAREKEQKLFKGRTPQQLPRR